MNNYRLLLNSKRQIRVVKEGWSWPAFFFTWAWGLSKELWFISGAFIGTVLILSFLIALAGGGDAGFLPFIFQLFAAAIFGANGNEWFFEDLKKKGFVLSDSKEFKGFESAVTYFKKNKNNYHIEINTKTSVTSSELQFQEESLNILFDNVDLNELRKNFLRFFENQKSYKIKEKYLNQLGYKYLKNGKHYESVEVFTNLLKLYPDSANGYASIADAYIELKDYDNAEYNLKIAAEKIIIDNTRDSDFKRNLLVDIKNKLNIINNFKRQQ